MKYLKIVLSVLALLANAAALVLTSGSPIQVSPQVLFAVQSAFAGIGILGISPIDLPDPIKRAFSAIAAVAAGIIGVHAGSVAAGHNPHPIIWSAFGFLVAIVGIMGKSLIPHAQSAAAKLDAPPPKTV